MPFINKNPLNYPVNSFDSIRVFKDDRPPTAADFKNFKVSDEWWDTSSNDFWKMVFKDGTQGTWKQMAGIAGAAEFFTPDVGGQVAPDALNNVNLLGDSVGFQNGMLFTGTPANNTLTAMDLRNITTYVVDAVAGQTEYQTVQAAIDAAQAAGGGTVYVRPGTYTEDLVLYDAVDITAAVATPAGFQTTIIGVHTPPATGDMSFRNLALSDTTDILASVAAGTTTIVIIDCVIDVANGYTFNLPNWTGLIVFMNSHCIGTQDGFADIGAGGANFLGLNSTLGVGNTNIMALGGANRINNCNIDCSMDWVGSASGIIRASQLTNTWLVSDDAACVMTDTLFITAASLTFLNHTSTGNVTLSNVTISTDQDPNVITGTGTVLFGSVVFVINSDINVAITKQSVGVVETGPTHIGSGFTNPTNHIDIVETVIAGDVIASLTNLDDTDPASDTQVDLIVGGTSAGDPFIHFDIAGSTEYSFGTDNSANDTLKITDGATPSAGNILMQYDPVDPGAGDYTVWTFNTPGNGTSIETFGIVGGNTAFPVRLAVVNTDANVASDVICDVRSSGGDAWTTFVNGAAADWTIGLAASAGNVLRIGHGARPSDIIAANLYMEFSGVGEITMPLQSAFLAYNSADDANQTGNGAVVTVDFDTELLDQNDDFAADTFTASVTGVYRFTASVMMTALNGATTTNLLLVTTTGSYILGTANPTAGANNAGAFTISGTILVPMTATNTAHITLQSTGAGADNNTIMGSASPYETWFSGKLEC